MHFPGRGKTPHVSSTDGSCRLETQPHILTGMNTSTATTTPTPETIAVIGAPSSCESAVLNLRTHAYRLPLLGRMLAFRVPFDGDTTELALATVTGVETINALHTANSQTARHVADSGAVGHQSGDAADTRAVSVKVEAVFRFAEGQWHKHSSTLSNSPATGTEVRVLDQATVDEVLGHDARDGFIGTLHGSGVLIPLTLPDFSGPRGAQHGAVVGQSGAGKSAAATALLSAQLRHAGQGHIIFDPQGQWATEHGTLWSLQGLARALGRKVTVARLSHSLRLRKDAPLLMDLLDEGGFFRKLAFGAGADDNVAQAKQTLASALNNRRLLTQAGIDDWASTRPDELLRFLLEELYQQLPAGMIYASRDPQRRVAATIHRPTEDADGNSLDEALTARMMPGALDEDGEHRFGELMAIFAPLASLWSPWSPTGMTKILAGTPDADLSEEDRRSDSWGLMREVMSPPAGAPAPLLILDLSADLSGMGFDLGEGDSALDSGAVEATRILDRIEVKARVMAQLLNTLLLAGQSEFSKGNALDISCWVDEAWNFAPPPEPKNQPAAVLALSNRFAGAARDARKLGIGLQFILQTPTGLREDIFKQLGVLMVGYGLFEPAEMKKLAGRVRDSHLKLYQTIPSPAASGDYTFMLVGGGFTGLSFGSNPVFLDMFNSGDEWLTANTDWVTAARRQFVQHLPDGDTGGPLEAMPPRPELTGAQARHDARKKLTDSNANATAVQAVARRKPTRKPRGETTAGGASNTRRTGINTSPVPVQTPSRFDAPPVF